MKKLNQNLKRMKRSHYIYDYGRFNGKRKIERGSTRLQRASMKSLKSCTRNSLISMKLTTLLPMRPSPMSFNTLMDHIIKGAWVKGLYHILVMKTKLSMRLTFKKGSMQKSIGMFLKFMNLTKLAFSL